jgi:hypothetical protein
MLQNPFLSRHSPVSLTAVEKAEDAVEGDRDGAYDWKPLVKRGTPWEQWSPEAPPEAIEDYNGSLHSVFTCRPCSTLAKNPCFSPARSSAVQQNRRPDTQ